MWIVSPMKTGLGKRSLSKPYVNALLLTIGAVRAIPIEKVQLNCAIRWPKGPFFANFQLEPYILFFMMLATIWQLYYSIKKIL